MYFFIIEFNEKISGYTKTIIKTSEKTYIIYTIFLKKASYQCFNY